MKNRGLFSAIGFLTIVPIKNCTITPITIACFPFVGLFIGGILFLLNFIFAELLLFPKDITATSLIVIYIILTGGLHIDALSDTVDGLFGRREKTEILSVMSDSHIGAEGVIAIVCDILLKFVLFVNIPCEVFPKMLLVLPVISRYSLVLAMFLSKPAKDEGLGNLFIKNTNIANLIIATLICFLITLWFLPALATIVIILSAGLVTISITVFFMKKIGGMTGDTIGAINEVVEIVSLLIFVILYG